MRPDGLLTNGMTLDQIRQEISAGMTVSELERILAQGVTADDVLKQVNAQQ